MVNHGMDGDKPMAEIEGLSAGIVETWESV